MSAPPSIRVRKGTADDFEFFKEVEFHTTWDNLPPEDQDRLDPDQVRHALEETHDILLARSGNALFIAETDAGEPVGLLWFGENRNLVTGEVEGWIYNVSVLPEFRGRGISLHLMQHAERYAREQGYEIIGLMVAVHNTVARRLYDKLEYREGNILMRKRLEGGS
jgi:ribosomal protein S18 acetylase RimI-like enzyme